MALTIAIGLIAGVLYGAFLGISLVIWMWDGIADIPLFWGQQVERLIVWLMRGNRGAA